MDFSLNRNQKAIKEMSRRFARDVIAPVAEEFERTGKHPYDILSQMGDLGMMGIPFPKTYGGGGGDWVSFNLCVEELSRVDMLPGVILDVTVTGAAQELFLYGTEEQKQRWLIPIVRGKTLGAIGLTEPDAGSDASSIRTSAVLDGDEWIINGSKQFITNTGLKNNSIVIVAAKTRRKSDGKETICTIIVPTDSPGYKVGQKYEKLGMRASSTHELFFDDCRVPRDCLLGEIEKGFSQRLSSLQAGRIAMGAIATGLAQACFDQAISFVKKNGKSQTSLFDSQTIPFNLADIAMRIELSRNMYLKAAWLKDQGENHTLEAHFAKLYATETATKIAAEVLKIFSPHGYLEQYPIARFFRQAKLNEIVEGTSEMQRLIIARELLF
ncbi:acyl-CoA dehydrogenase family protein [Thermodesulfobacteriota bacterium]